MIFPIMIIDAEKKQWILVPKQREEEEPRVPVIEERKFIKLSSHNYSALYEKLAEHNCSTNWREIGTHLGFLSSELDHIQARPLLLSDAPKSWLGAMLEKWLQWAPGDQRGSTECANLEGLSDALNKAGLSEAAWSIMTLELTA